MTSAGMSWPRGRVAVTPRGPEGDQPWRVPGGLDTQRARRQRPGPRGEPGEDLINAVQSQRVIEWAGRTAGGLRVGAVDGRLMGLTPRPEGQRAGSGQESEARQVAGRVAQRLHQNPVAITEPADQQPIS